MLGGKEGEKKAAKRPAYLPAQADNGAMEGPLPAGQVGSSLLSSGSREGSKKSSIHVSTCFGIKAA